MKQLWQLTWSFHSFYQTRNWLFPWLQALGLMEFSASSQPLPLQNSMLQPCFFICNRCMVAWAVCGTKRDLYTSTLPSNHLKLVKCTFMRTNFVASSKSVHPHSKRKNRDPLSSVEDCCKSQAGPEICGHLPWGSAYSEVGDGKEPDGLSCCRSTTAATLEDANFSQLCNEIITRLFYIISLNNNNIVNKLFEKAHTSWWKTRLLRRTHGSGEKWCVESDHDDGVVFLF